MPCFDIFPARKLFNPRRHQSMHNAQHIDTIHAQQSVGFPEPVRMATGFTSVRVDDVAHRARSLSMRSKVFRLSSSFLPPRFLVSL